MTASPERPGTGNERDALPAGYLVTPPRLPRPVTFDQRWSDLTFVHWPVAPDAVAHLYPPGTRPDVFVDGATYVGLVPFNMSYTKLVGAVPLPYFGRFLETNVRLYSVDDSGRHGVLFRSLETARLAVVPVTRVGLGIPYTWAKMRMTRSGRQITYDSVRRWPHRGLRSLMTVTVGDLIEPTPLEVWLTARWGAHTRKAGRTWWVPNEHIQWPLHAAEVAELHDELVNAAGIKPTGHRLRAVYSPGVQTNFGRPCVVR
ncbi:YqjF family protein [Mycobacterium sp. ML4]